jgi:hypothetical protein
MAESSNVPPDVTITYVKKSTSDELLSPTVAFLFGKIISLNFRIGPADKRDRRKKNG